MTKIRLTLNALAVLGICLICSSMAQAQATRTWVSGVGDDANPCSRTAPCKTFAGAISKTAPAGEINVLDPGGFGAVTITKAMTIRSECVEAGVLVSGTNAIIISAGASDVVTLYGLDINGLNTGINGVHIISAKTVNVIKCEIYEFGVPGNPGSGGRGINDQRTTGGQLFVIDSIIRNNAGTGVVILPSSGAVTINAVLDRVRITSNGGNAQAGLDADAGSQVTISNSVISGQGGSGLFAENGGVLNVENCMVTGNSVGISSSGATIRISNNHVANNATGLSGATFATYGNNKIAGNGTGNSVPGSPAVTAGQ